MKIKENKTYNFGTIFFDKKESFEAKRGQLSGQTFKGYHLTIDNTEEPFKHFFIGKNLTYNLWFLLSEVDEQIHYALGSKLSTSVSALEYLFEDKEFITSAKNIINSNIQTGNISEKFKSFVPKYFTVIGKNAIDDITGFTGIERHTNSLVKFSEKYGLYKYFDFIDNHRNVFTYNNTLISNGRININFPKEREIIYIEDYLNNEELDNMPIPMSNDYSFNHPNYMGYYGKRIDIMSKNLSHEPLIMYYPKNNIAITCDFCHNGEEWFGKIFNLFIEKCNLKQINDSKELRILVGCDPEFELYSERDVIEPPSPEFRGITRLRGRLGTDGAGSQIELRPEPGTPEKVTEGIREIFKTIDNKNVSTCGDKYPLGGHIHIGATKAGVIFLPQCTNELLNLFDMFIGKPTVALSGKGRGSYKELGQMRQNEWGFEYRTPPACIFSNPKITRIVLKIAKNLATHYYNKEKMKIQYFVDFDNYSNYCSLTEKEYSYFKNWCEKSYQKTKNNNIIKFWTKIGKEEKLEIIFRDKWEKVVIDYIVSVLKSMVVPYHTKIIFYGLENGTFSGFQNSLAGNVLHPKMNNNILNEGICFGLCSVYRETLDKNMLSEICKIIKSKMSFLFELDKDIPRTTTTLFPEEITSVNQHAVQDDGRLRGSREGAFRGRDVPVSRM